MLQVHTTTAPATITRPSCPPPLVPLAVVEAPDLAEQAHAAGQASQIPQAARPEPGPGGETPAGRALALLLGRLLGRDVPPPAVPYLQAGTYLFSVCLITGEGGAEYGLSLVQPCSTPGCAGVAFSAPIRRLADVGAARQPGTLPQCTGCAAAGAAIF